MNATLELYNMSVEFRQVMLEVEAQGGLLTPELEARLEVIEPEARARIKALALACLEWDRVVDVLEVELGRLGERRQKLKNSAHNLRSLIAECMAISQIGTVKEPEVTVSFAPNPVKYVWEGVDPKSIPDEFRRDYVEHRLNREAVDRAVAEGRDLPEGIRATRGFHVRIS